MTTEDTPKNDGLYPTPDALTAAQPAPEAPEWCVALVSKRALVMHQPTQVMGRVKSFRGPTPECQASTLEVEPGHTFVAKEEDFLVLTEQQSKFVEAVGKAMRHFTGEAITLAASCGLDAPPAMRLLGSLLRIQGMMLGQAAVKAANAPTMPAPPEPTGTA